MSNFISRLFHLDKANQAPGNIDRGYVSEHTRFIDQFLESHPDVLEEQHVGRLIYWERKVDLAAQEKAEKDNVPDDGYGFYSSAWRATKH